MKPDVKEKRENERIFFTLEENIGVTVELFGKGKTIPAALLSISSGGLSIAATKKEKKNIQEGDTLIVSRLHLPGLHEAIARIEVEVKHILFYKDYDRMSIGCAFKNSPDLITKKIEEFVNERLETQTLGGNDEGLEV
jgi:c-di-GMP-binding flagellar brake protein YcgR